MTPCRIEDVLASEGVYAATTWGTSMYPMLRSGRDTVILRPRAACAATMSHCTAWGRNMFCIE